MYSDVALATPARHPNPKSLSRSALTLIALVLSGCTTIQVAPPPAMSLPTSFSAAPTGQNSVPLTEPARWWSELNDPALNGLIEKALVANHDVRIALANLREARAISNVAESLLEPTIEAGATAIRSRQRSQLYSDTALPNGMYLPQGTGIASPFSTGSAAGFSAAWEVDIFGAHGSDAEAARQAALGYEEKLHGAEMLLASDLAINYLEARGIAQRSEVLEKSINTLESIQRYASGRYRSGQSSQLELDNIARRMAALEGQRHLLTLMSSVRLRRIAVLSGQQSDALMSLPAAEVGVADSLQIALPLPAVLPSDVLELRPDVRGSANIVRAQAARLGSARADLLPKFYLGFLQQYGHLDISGTHAGVPLTSMGAGVRIPVFEGGRIRAAIAAQDARLDSAAIQYEKTVLTALEDVNNAYSARKTFDQRCSDLERSRMKAEEAERHAYLLFEYGRELLQVALQARLDLQEQQDLLIQCRIERATSTVQLYKAIGAGWFSKTMDKHEI